MSNLVNSYVFSSALALTTGFTHRYNDDDMPDVAGEVPSWNDLVVSDDLTDLGNSTRTPDFSSSAINGHNAVLFDGTNHMLSKTFTLTQPVTIFLVIKQITWINNDTMLNGIGSNQFLWRMHTTTPKTHLYAGSSGADDANMVIGTWHVVSLIGNGASSSIRVDDNSATSASIGTQDPGGIELARNGTAAYCNMSITELVIYETALSSGDRDASHDFLKDKYAL